MKTFVISMFCLNIFAVMLGLVVMVKKEFPYKKTETIEKHIVIMIGNLAMTIWTALILFG